MKVTVGIAQASPVVLDLSRSLQKACALIKQAGKQGINILAFPETWIPVYPVWVDMGGFSRWDDEASKRLYTRLYNNSIDVRTSQFETLRTACKESSVTIVLGINEREKRSRTLFNSLIFINEKGDLLGVHRKLIPTFGERLIWGRGGGNALTAYETSAGRLGGLICWEHWMPPVRQALHESGETIHVASWPHGKERHQIASRHYAFEGRCFVLAAAMYLEKSMFPADFEFAGALNAEPEVLLPGGSAIIAPDGEYVIPPLYDREELIAAEIDTDRTIAESLTLDVTGHYSRPDIFRLVITPHS
jgi:nitrilase